MQVILSCRNGPGPEVWSIDGGFFRGARHQPTQTLDLESGLGCPRLTISTHWIQKDEESSRVPSVYLIWISTRCVSGPIFAGPPVNHLAPVNRAITHRTSSSDDDPPARAPHSTRRWQVEARVNMLLLPLVKEGQIALLVMSIIFAVIPTVAVVLRLIARRIAHRRLDAGDICIICAWVCLLSCLPYSILPLFFASRKLVRCLG